MTFREFIKEREAIRLGKQTDDLILKEYKFTNINRKHDKGCVRLVKEIGHLPIQESIHSIAEYRFLGSSHKYFDGHRICGTTYCVPRCLKGQNYYDIVDKMVKSIVDNVEYIMDSTTIIEVTDKLLEITSVANESGIMYVFHNTEIAKDIAMIYPNKINPLSECYTGKGAYIGIKALEGRLTTKDPTATVKGIQLIKKHKEISTILKDLMYDDWSFCDIEHALCEYGKYEKIRIFGVGKKRNRLK